MADKKAPHTPPLTPTEKADFKQAMDGVKPLDKSPKLPPKACAAKPDAAPALPAHPKQERTRLNDLVVDDLDEPLIDAAADPLYAVFMAFEEGTQAEPAPTPEQPLKTPAEAYTPPPPPPGGHTPPGYIPPNQMHHDGRDHARLAGWRGGVDQKLRKTLAAGDITPTRRIDLHGYTLAEAYPALTAFLDKSWRMGHKCVLVIHGKGFGFDGGMGVIRRSLPDWLDLLPFVLAYHTAAGRHGGAGASYVLLKRHDKGNK